MPAAADNLAESRQLWKLNGLKSVQPLVGERAELFNCLMGALPQDDTTETDDLRTYSLCYILTCSLERLRRLADGDPRALANSALRTIAPRIKGNNEAELAIAIVCGEALREAGEAIESKQEKARANALRALREAEAELKQALREDEEAGGEFDPGQPSA